MLLGEIVDVLQVEPVTVDGGVPETETLVQPVEVDVPVPA